MKVVITLYKDWYWTQRRTWVNSALINLMHLLVDEVFPPMMDHAEDDGAPFTISVRDVIARCELVLRFPSSAWYVRTNMPSGDISTSAYDHPNGRWYRSLFGAGVFTNRPADTSYVPENPSM